MVKLSTVRSSRLYGPPASRWGFETANAVIYLLATLLLLVGVEFQLPGSSNVLGLALLLFALLLLVAINLHDFHAHLAGIEFQLDRVRSDKQLALVELMVPILYAVGSALIFVGLLFLMRTSHGTYYSLDLHSPLMGHSVRLMVAGTALWLLGSVLNNLQAYERTPLQIQAYNKCVLVFMLLGSTLIYLSALCGLPRWPRDSLAQIADVAVRISLVGSALLVLGAIINIAKVVQMQRMERLGTPLEPVHGDRTPAEAAEAPLLHDRSVVGPETTIAEEVTYATSVEEPERLY